MRTLQRLRPPPPQGVNHACGSAYLCGSHGQKHKTNTHICSLGRKLRVLNRRSAMGGLHDGWPFEVTPKESSSGHNRPKPTHSGASLARFAQNRPMFPQNWPNVGQIRRARRNQAGCGPTLSKLGRGCPGHHCSASVLRRGRPPQGHRSIKRRPERRRRRFPSDDSRRPSQRPRSAPWSERRLPPWLFYGGGSTSKTTPTIAPSPRPHPCKHRVQPVEPNTSARTECRDGVRQRRWP